MLEDSVAHGLQPWLRSAAAPRLGPGL